MICKRTWVLKPTKTHRIQKFYTIQIYFNVMAVLLLTCACSAFREFETNFGAEWRICSKHTVAETHAYHRFRCRALWTYCEQKTPTVSLFFSKSSENQAQVQNTYKMKEKVENELRCNERVVKLDVYNTWNMSHRTTRHFTFSAKSITTLFSLKAKRRAQGANVHSVHLRETNQTNQNTGIEGENGWRDGELFKLHGQQRGQRKSGFISTWFQKVIVDYGI